MGAYSDFFPFETLGHFDARIRADHETAVMKASHQENRQRNEWSAERARDHVGGGGHLTDIELDIAHHAPERPDDRHDLDEVGLHAGDRHRPVLDVLGMAVAGDCNLQSRLGHCFGIPALSITAAHFLMSAAMRSRISSGLLPRAAMPSADAVAWRVGSASAALMS